MLVLANTIAVSPQGPGRPSTVVSTESTSFGRGYPPTPTYIHRTFGTTSSRGLYRGLAKDEAVEINPRLATPITFGTTLCETQVYDKVSPAYLTGQVPMSRDPWDLRLCRLAQERSMTTQYPEDDKDWHKVRSTINLNETRMTLYCLTGESRIKPVDDAHHLPCPGLATKAHVQEKQLIAIQELTEIFPEDERNSPYVEIPSYDEVAQQVITPTATIQASEQVDQPTDDQDDANIDAIPIGLGHQLAIADTVTGATSLPRDIKQARPQSYSVLVLLLLQVSSSIHRPSVEGAYQAQPRYISCAGQSSDPGIDKYLQWRCEPKSRHVIVPTKLWTPKPCFRTVIKGDMCIGWAKSQGRQCNTTIGIAKVREHENLMVRLNSGRWSSGRITHASRQDQDSGKRPINYSGRQTIIMDSDNPKESLECAILPEAMQQQITQPGSQAANGPTIERTEHYQPGGRAQKYRRALYRELVQHGDRSEEAEDKHKAAEAKRKERLDLFDFRLSKEGYHKLCTQASSEAALIPIPNLRARVSRQQ
ncbi:hypothetical protein FBULB1_1844 [Fusarium bulbicola]|nr:hypothetical protein FBULB1_1844 [Fusarium bulbicola]